MFDAQKEKFSLWQLLFSTHDQMQTCSHHSISRFKQQQ